MGTTAALAAAGASAAEQVVQVLGALLILAGFGAAQFGRLRIDGAPYLALNLAGSAVLAWLAFAQAQYGFLLLEGVWAVVSLWGLIALARGRSPRAPGA